MVMVAAVVALSWSFLIKKQQNSAVANYRMASETFYKPDLHRI